MFRSAGVLFVFLALFLSSNHLRAQGIIIPWGGPVNAGMGGAATAAGKAAAAEGTGCVGAGGSGVATAAVALTLVIGGCDDDMSSPSTLERPQILAVQLSPRALTPGVDHELRALGHALDDTALSWEACVLPWIPEESANDT